MFGGAAMYVFVLIMTHSGYPTIPGPLPRFETEQQCHAFGDPILEKLREQVDAQLDPMGRWIAARSLAEFGC
jgi:hypothetical protein